MFSSENTLSIPLDSPYIHRHPTRRSVVFIAGLALLASALIRVVRSFLVGALDLQFGVLLQQGYEFGTVKKTLLSSG